MSRARDLLISLRGELVGVLTLRRRANDLYTRDARTTYDSVGEESAEGDEVSLAGA